MKNPMKWPKSNNSQSKSDFYTNLDSQNRIIVYNKSNNLEFFGKVWPKLEIQEVFNQRTIICQKLKYQKF